MAKYKEILNAIAHLTAKLYGENGFEGDITAIKDDIKAIHDHLEDHSKRITTAEILVNERTASKISKKAIAGYGGGTILVVITLVVAIGQMMGWW